MNEFFSAVLPATGRYRIQLLPLRGKPESLWFDSLEDFCEAADAHAGVDRVYFGTASYIQSGDGHATNVELNKALRLDIDAGQVKFDKHRGEGVYRTQRDALAALRDFIKNTSLKPSWIVSSGEGLHVYFALERALPPKEWSAWATRLYDLCEQQGMLVDHTTTCDVTRLLRVPGSRHELGKPVQILAGSGAAISLDKLDKLLPTRPTYSAEDLSFNDEFNAAKAEREYPPSSALKIARACAALREVADTRGDTPEPQWRAMVGLVKATVEGNDLVHEWSSGYDGYDERETQKKIDLWRTGPTTCDEFAKHSRACASCPHRGKIKSPIQLGLLNDEEQAELPPSLHTTIISDIEAPEPQGKPWDGMLPPGARVVIDDNGRPALQFRHKKVDKDEDGKPVTSYLWVPVSNSVFWFSQWGAASSSQDSAQSILCVWAGTHVARYEIDQTAFSSPSKLIEALASKAVHPTTHPLASRVIHQYALSQHMHIEHLHKTLRVTDRFGVRITDSGEVVAVHGRYTIHGDGTIRDTILGPALRPDAQAFPIPLPPTPPGTELWGPEVWDSSVVPAAHRYVEFLRRYYGSEDMRPYQLAIMLMLASPLMAFVTGHFTMAGDLPQQSALSVSLYSKDGGYGKTAACQAGAMAFGDPARLTRGQGAVAATDFSRIARLSMLGTMPSVMDEVGDLSPQQVFNLLSTVANGVGRERLTRGGHRMQSSPYSLINVLTTNRSLQELLSAGDSVSGDAVHRRILEINVGGMPRPSREQREGYAREFGEVARTCAGALGAVLQREIARLGVERVQATVHKWVAYADKHSDAGMADRFLYRAVGAMLTVYTLLEPLKLVPFPAKQVMAEYLRVYALTRDVINAASRQSDPLELLNRALNDLMPKTLITEGEGTPNGRPEPILNARIPDQIVARHFRGGGRTWLSVDALREWCRGARCSENEIITAAKNANVLRLGRAGSSTRRSVRRTLTRCVAIETDLAMYAYDLDVRHLTRLLRAADGDVTGDPDHMAEVIDMEKVRKGRDEPAGEDAAPGAEEAAP